MTAVHRLSLAAMTMASIAALSSLAVFAQVAQLPAPAPLPPSPAAATRPSAAGRLRVHAVQKTANAPIPSLDNVAIHFQGAGHQLSPAAGRLDATGSALLEGIPLTAAPIEPIAVVEHGGVQYQAVGRPMDSSVTDQQIEVPVFEVTERMPEWSMPTCQVVLSRTSDGVRVFEAIAVENPSDRTWIGAPDALGQRPTVAIPLPQGARDLRFGGDFSAAQTHFDGNMLRHSAPLFPGLTQYEVSYTLPAVGPQMVVAITAPAMLHELNVFAADDGNPVVACGLDAQGVTQMQDGKARWFSAKELKSGQMVSVTLAMVSSPASAGDPTPVVLPKVIVGTALVGLLVIGAVVMFLRSTRQSDEA